MSLCMCTCSACALKKRCIKNNYNCIETIHTSSARSAYQCYFVVQNYKKILTGQYANNHDNRKQAFCQQQLMFHFDCLQLMSRILIPHMRDISPCKPIPIFYICVTTCHEIDYVFVHMIMRWHSQPNRKYILTQLQKSINRDLLKTLRAEFSTISVNAWH